MKGKTDLVRSRDASLVFHDALNYNISHHFICSLV